MPRSTTPRYIAPFHRTPPTASRLPALTPCLPTRARRPPFFFLPFACPVRPLFLHFFSPFPPPFSPSFSRSFAPLPIPEEQGLVPVSRQKGFFVQIQNRLIIKCLKKLQTTLLIIMFITTPVMNIANTLRKSVGEGEKPKVGRCGILVERLCRGGRKIWSGWRGGIFASIGVSVREKWGVTLGKEDDVFLEKDRVCRGKAGAALEGR